MTQTLTPPEEPLFAEARLRELAPPDERAARQDLLRQVARLEAELCATGIPTPPARRARPRLLDLAGLERARDDLLARLDAVRAEALAEEARRAEARALLEAMYADPGAHKWTRITRDDLGLEGCGHYHVRPRLGPIGLLRGWWVVKVSSGCPLAT
jgi:hypothetical protein